MCKGFTTSQLLLAYNIADRHFLYLLSVLVIQMDSILTINTNSSYKICLKATVWS